MQLGVAQMNKKINYNKKEFTYENLTNLAIKFQKGLIGRRQFLSKISLIILSIPKQFNVTDEDESHEFFAFILSKIDNLMARYKVQEDASFYTWLNFVLKRQFRNFEKLRKTKVVFDNEKTLKNYYNKVEFQLEQDNHFEKELANIDFSLFNDAEKQIIAYKYGLYIKKYCNTIPTMDKISKRIEKKRVMESNACRSHYKILKLQEKLKNENDKEEIEKILIKEKIAIKAKRNIEKRIKKLRIVPTNTWLAEKLGISRLAIIKAINNIKVKLNNQLSNKYN